MRAARRSFTIRLRTLRTTAVEPRKVRPLYRQINVMSFKPLSDPAPSMALVEDFSADDNCVRLNMGAPGPDTLKRVTKLMADASTLRLADELRSKNAGLLQYGVVCGERRFLKALAEFLSRQYGETVDCDNLVTTSGASMGLYVLLTQIASSRTGSMPIFCERVTYHIALRIFDQMRWPVHAVDADENGMRPEALEAKLKSILGVANEDDDCEINGIVYLVPVFQNPSGSVLSEGRAQAIVKLARQYKVLVFCDDVYNLLSYDGGTPPRRLFAYDNPSDPDYLGSVVSNGSFSKLLAPGLRLGWMELPQKLKQKYWLDSAVLSSGGCLNQYTSGVVAPLLESGQVDDFVKGLRQEYGRRARQVHEVLTGEMPAGTVVSQPRGGFFLWVTLPLGMDAGALLSRAQSQHGIFAARGKWFSPASDGHANDLSNRSFRLSVSFYPAPVLRQAASRLAAIAREMAEG